MAPADGTERQRSAGEDRRRLLEEARAGRPGAWERLVDRYEQLVLAVPRRLGLSAADGEEVVQATWLALYEHVRHIQRPESLPSWILTTAGREARRLRARRAREAPATPAPDEPPAPEDLPPEVALRLERIQAVRDAIGALDPRCRRLLERLYLDPEPASYRAVARALGMPIGSVGPVRQRCLARLAERLEREGFA